MSAILNSLNVHNFLIFQPILMILVSKFMVCRALSDKTYLLLGLRSPLNKVTLLLWFVILLVLVSVSVLFSPSMCPDYIFRFR